MGAGESWKRTIQDYEDIIHLPHHQSQVRPHMSNYDRAAQFSPFAALTGYEAAVKETARLTDERVELDEYTKEVLDKKLRILQENLNGSRFTITYFQPDNRKSGGAYLSVTGKVKRVKTHERIIFMQDGTEIPMDDIVDIQDE